VVRTAAAVRRLTGQSLLRIRRPSR
jgi:hypothetical protein